MTSTPPIAVSTGLLRGYFPLQDSPVDPRDWAGPLALLAELGADELDFSQFWGPLSDLTDAQIDLVGRTVSGLGMRVSGISVIDVPLAPLDQWGIHESRILRTIDQAQALGANHVSLGVHAMPRAGVPLVVPNGPVALHAHEARGFRAALRTLAGHASEREVTLSLEMHEHTALSTSASVMSLIEGIPGVGSNPDLGNVIRAPWPLAESALETIVGLGSSIVYWHVKNAARFEVATQQFRSIPTTMELGSIDYRAALAVAIGNGFRGPLVIEHYGGDTLWHARSAIGYLRSVLADVARKR